ncbi:hypothetical protein Glove_117g626 [Diversispora epigaea]|uniref:Uncharacterized protein n=1 Tax=Diversispora epigaea TaxID=1348612 RepID=A0A397J4H8_9GLOM|nr:hypothetical protein Glove_117g626 [Diversispora epigaea]
MTNYKDIESALHHDVKYVAKQRVPNEEIYNEKIADFKDWYNKEVYTSLEKLYKLYFELILAGIFELASQEEVVKKRSKEERVPNEEIYNEKIADFKDWYNKEVYTSLEKLYKLYFELILAGIFELASQEEVVKKRSKEEEIIHCRQVFPLILPSQMTS